MRRHGAGPFLIKGASLVSFNPAGLYEPLQADDERKLPLKKYAGKLHHSSGRKQDEDIHVSP